MEKSNAPKNECELAELVDRALDDVPLDESEMNDTIQETGIDPNRLVARLQARLQKVRREETVAKFAAAEQARLAAKTTIQQRLAQPRSRTVEEAQSRLRELRARGGPTVEMHFHKLEHMSIEDMNRIIDELEVLLGEDEE